MKKMWHPDQWRAKKVRVKPKTQVHKANLEHPPRANCSQLVGKNTMRKRLIPKINPEPSRRDLLRAGEIGFSVADFVGV
jgi:hypothetical protein